MRSEDTHTKQDAELESAQNAYLARHAPGFQTRRIRWSGGVTQMIEVGRGPPLLLLHGGLGEAFQWAPILAELSRQRRVLAVDRPGHGLADPFDYRKVDLLSHARDFLRDILDAEGLSSVPIVGTSMGGLWAVAFALAYPARVEQLLLPGSPAGLTREVPLQMRIGTLPVLKPLVHAMMRRPTPEGTRDFWKQLLVARPERLEDEFLRLSVASQKRNCASWFTLIDRALNYRGIREELLLKDRWKELLVPTTIILGDQDAFGGFDAADAAAKANARIKIVRIAEAGHAPWFDQPAEFLDVIERTL